MSDKDKTPEELAEEAFNAIPLVDTIKKAAPKVHETSLFWFTAGFEAGYEAGRPKWVSVCTPPKVDGEYAIIVREDDFVQKAFARWEGGEWDYFLPKRITHYCKAFDLPPTKDD